MTSMTSNHGGRWRNARRDATVWAPRAVHTLIVAPHPDDEILLFAGLIGHQLGAGVSIEVLAVTDGEAAYGQAESPVLAARRRSEQDAALRTMDGHIGIVRLGVEDGAVAAQIGMVREAIADLSRADGIIAAPWHLDHHCDHEAVGRAARMAPSDRQLVQGLFWGWHHRTPAALTAPLRRLPLSAATLARRSAALACHESQITHNGAPPVLDAHVLEPMSWPDEYHIVNPTDAD